MKNPQNSEFRFSSNRLRNEQLGPTSRTVIYCLKQCIIPNIITSRIFFFYEKLNIKRIFIHTGRLLFFSYVTYHLLSGIKYTCHKIRNSDKVPIA